MIKNGMIALIKFWKKLPLALKIIFCVGIFICLILVAIGVATESFFTYDQARDALQAYSIWHDHHVKILGPETDIPGVFHGVLWYYILAVLYGIGRLPGFAIAVFGILSCATVLIGAILSHRLFKNAVVTTLTVIFYALSPLFQVTTRWISNPILAFLLTPLLLLLLWSFIERQKAWIAFWIGVCFGIIIQGEFAFVVLLLILPIYWLIFRWKIRFFDVVGFFVGLALATGSFFVAEVKFKGQALRGIVQFLHQSGSSRGIIQTFSFIWTRILDLLSISFCSFPRIIEGVLALIFVAALVMQYRSKWKKSILFLVIWDSLLFIFLFFHVGISTSYFLFYPFLIATIILVSFLLSTIYKKIFIFWPLVIILMALQVYSSVSFLESNTSPLPAQQGTTLPLAKQVIAYTYQQALGKTFTIVTITNPLFINTTWAYLYTTYGLPTYGYVPYFAGRSQGGQLGYLPEKQFATKVRFLIIEPPIGIPDFYIHKITADEDLVSKVITVQHFGDYIIEKRQLTLQ